MNVRDSAIAFLSPLSPANLPLAGDDRIDEEELVGPSTGASL
jgi:hypothetical protein